MKKILLLNIWVVLAFNAFTQTITINYQNPTQTTPANFQPGIQMVPKTPAGTNDFLNNGIHHNTIRVFSIESAINYWTVSSINDVMAQLEILKPDILLANSRCNTFILPIFKMPLWLSSSTDTTEINGGFRIYNAMPPANYATWNLLVDSIVSKINDQWGLSPYYEFWNEPDNGYWKGTTEEYFKLFKSTYFAVKTNHPAAKFGGPTVGGFTAEFAPSLPGGYLDNTQLDSTIIGMTIDSCISWNAPLDFISWHKFEPALKSIDDRLDYLNQKLTNTGHGIVPYIISEWNQPHNLRESIFDAPFMVNFVLASVENNIYAQSVASWQDFNEETDEFHQDYGLVSWNGLHKPSWKSLLLLNKLNGALLEVDNSDFNNLASASSYHNDTLKILVSNYSFPGLETAILSLYHDFHLNSNDLSTNGYTSAKLDSIFQGLILLTGSDALTSAINSVIPIYQTSESYYQNGRNIDLLIPEIIGNHTGIQTTLDSSNNNVILQYDSLINAGYNRTNAVNYLYPNNFFETKNISITDSIYSTHMQPNSVSLIELYLPEIALPNAINELNTSTTILYPNPTSGIVHINIDKQYLQRIDIYGINGRLQKTLTSSSFSIKEFNSGIYILVIQTNKGTVSKRLIKE